MFEYIRESIIDFLIYKFIKAWKFIEILLGIRRIRIDVLSSLISKMNRYTLRIDRVLRNCFLSRI